MELKCGTIIPFQYKDVKKLVVISGGNSTEELNISDVKNAVRLAFTVDNYEFYNKKIGFRIPDELLIPYLKQCRNLTNFVIEIIETEKVVALDEQSHYKALNKARPRSLVSNEPKRGFQISDDDVPVEKKSKHVANDIDSYLEDILQTSEGQEMCVNFKNSNGMNNKDRLNLINLVITYEFKNILISNYPLSLESQRYIDLAAAIARRFPGEESTTYYVPHSKCQRRIAGGKLFEHFNAMKCRYLKTEGSTRYCNSKLEIVDADFPELDDLLEIIDDWRPYLTAWQQSFDVRMAYVRNINKPLTYFEKFISPVDINGIKLVEYDFERLHPEKSKQLLDIWDQMSERIFTEAIVSCRNDVPLILDHYGNIPQLSAFMMLGYFFRNYESDVKSFKKDDPGNLVVHINTIDETPVDILKEYCRNHNQLDPMVFVTGKNTEKLCFYVLVGDSLYYMDTALNAIDFCFKCYQVLQCPYPKRQSQVWQVIQKVLYGIHKEEDDLNCENFLNIFKSS